MKKDKLIILLFFIFTFIFFMLFFIKIHPIVMFDTDDWCYSFTSRVAYPISSSWNPTRILPETIYPCVLLIGNILLSIFSSNFFGNVIIINSFVVSSFIIFYIYSFYNLMKEKFKLSVSCNILILSLFILLHFLIFRIYESNNVYMFYSLDACCYYYYLIPGLLNISLVMNYITYEKLYFKDNLFKTSIIVLLCYLAIFSNLFHSVILASFIGINLLIKIINQKLFTKKYFKSKIKEFIFDNILEILILISWFVVQLLELNGGRASSLDNDIGFLNMFKNSIKDFLSIFKLLNPTFIKIFVFSLIISVYIFIKEKLFKNKYVINSIIALFLVLLYLLLVCSKAGSWYITRADVLIGIVFYIFIMICFVFAYLLKKHNRFIIICPLLLFILFFEINTSGTTFKESNVNNISPEDVLKINKEILRQIKEASYDNSRIIYIPAFESDDNWPIASYGQNWIIESLNKHGVIKNSFTGNFEISNDYYKRILEKQ